MTRPTSIRTNLTWCACECYLCTQIFRAENVNVDLCRMTNRNRCSMSTVENSLFHQRILFVCVGLGWYQVSYDERVSRRSIYFVAWDMQRHRSVYVCKIAQRNKSRNSSPLWSRNENESFWNAMHEYPISAMHSSAEQLSVIFCWLLFSRFVLILEYEVANLNGSTNTFSIFNDDDVYDSIIYDAIRTGILSPCPFIVLDVFM